MRPSIAIDHILRRAKKASTQITDLDWINAPTDRIACGADERLLNTIAEKILGLPQDPRPDKGVAFNQNSV